MIRENWVYRRGGIRPVVVIQNNRGNYHAPTLIVATVISIFSDIGRSPRLKMQRSGIEAAHGGLNVLLNTYRPPTGRNNWKKSA